jgi:hypothetical protein
MAQANEVEHPQWASVSVWTEGLPRGSGCATGTIVCEPERLEEVRPQLRLRAAEGNTAIRPLRSSVPA